MNMMAPSQNIAELAQTNAVLREQVAMREQAEAAQRVQLAAMATAMDGMAILDPDETYVYMNDAHVKIYGYDRAEELIGKSWRVLYDEDEVESVERDYFPVLWEKGRWRGVLKGKRCDGSTFDVEASLTLLEEGGMICVCRDITARKRIGEALHAVTEATASVTGRGYFRSLVQHLAAAFRVKYAFVAECADSAKTKVRTLAFLQDGEFLENIEYDLAGMPCKGVVGGKVGYHPDRLEERFPKEVGLVSYLGVPILDAAGQVLGHLAVVDDKPMHRAPQDVSIMKIFAARAGAELERERTEEALRRSAKRLETLQEIDRAILVARSPAEIAQAALRHIQQLIPCLRADVVVFDFAKDKAVLMAAHVRGKTEVGTGTHLTLEEFGMADELRQGEAQVVDDVRIFPRLPKAIETLGKEGLRSYIKVPLLAQGELIGALNLGSDRPGAFADEHVDIAREVANSLAIAMQQAHLHEQVERHAAELEQRVTERTAELEAFSYSVSHDLRTPLLTIDGFSRMLLEDYTDALDAEGQRQLQVICNNAEKMGQLIDDLLAFSRIGRREMVPSPINMNELAKTVFEELSAANPERELHLKMQAIPSSFGDQAMIGQVFTNLLSNAIKFTRPQEAAVIEVGARTEDGETVFFVKDNGVGFDMAYADKLFGVFQRLHSDEEFEGTGVGLAIVQRIIHRHGGRVWAESEIGKGATIYFTLSCTGGAG